LFSCAKAPDKLVRATQWFGQAAELNDGTRNDDSESSGPVRPAPRELRSHQNQYAGSLFPWPALASGSNRALLRCSD